MALKDVTTLGYSGTPLWKKLGFKPRMKVCALNPPKHYAQLIDGPNDWVMVKQPKDADAIHLFITERQELSAIAILSTHMPPAIMLWVSWPKKTSRRHSCGGAWCWLGRYQGLRG
jgi:hypothetical protein